MAEKLPTLDHLKKLALRGTSDSAARVAELAELVAAGLEDARHVGIAVILPSGNWTGNVQTVKNEFLLADSAYWYLVCGANGVRADDITVNGEVTFRCETTPAEDLTVHILRLEVES